MLIDRSKTAHKENDYRSLWWCADFDKGGNHPALFVSFIPLAEM